MSESNERRKVLITGASSGIGLSAAERFAKAGYDVALVARGSGLETAAERVRSHGAEAFVFYADVSDLDALEAAVRGAHEKLGRLDVAVLNAAVGTFGTFKELSKEDFDRVVDVTFTATVNATRLVLPLLELSEGTIVFTGSVAGQMPVPLMTPYCAAKHALRGFVGALRAELRTEGSKVSISMVSPGPVDTPFWLNVGTPAGRTTTSAPKLAAYDVESVSAEILRMAEHPKREVTVGGAFKAGRAIYAAGGPLTEWAFGRVMRQQAETAPGEPARRRSLAGPNEESQESGGRAGRPSLLGLAHGLTGRLRQNLAARS
jgi:short-subunit dehydrogenase